MYLYTACVNYSGDLIYVYVVLMLLETYKVNESNTYECSKAVILYHFWLSQSKYNIL